MSYSLEATDGRYVSKEEMIVPEDEKKEQKCTHHSTCNHVYISTEKQSQHDSVLELYIHSMFGIMEQRVEVYNIV